ncbi:MAG: hypothetical protein Q8M08_02130 [Bacteroidales bacterium]|nr:hypothetical protein [Bacteroidales bacterium]
MPHKAKSLIVFLCIFNVAGYAQFDSTLTQPKKRSWYLPNGFYTEYAGGFGMLSAGILFRPLKKTEVAISVGYTPPVHGNIWTANALVSYTLFRIRLNKQFTFHLLKTGAFVNFNFGKNIYLKWPSRYPDDYYWWNSSIRYGPFVDTELKYSPVKNNFACTFFFQCLTNDLYLYSYLPNMRFFSFCDILVFGIGIKVSWISLYKPKMHKKIVMQ